MDGEALALRRLDRLIWATVASVAAIVVAAPLASNFYIEWRAFAAPALASASPGGGERVLPVLAQRSAPGVGPQLHRAGGSLRGRRRSAVLHRGQRKPAAADHTFDLLDRALGIDWKALLAWMNDAPAVYAVLRRPISASRCR